jgi:hypothetical protein
MMVLRPVPCSAVVMAMRLASVPELVNRTRSSPKRSHMRSASTVSAGWMPPTLTLLFRAAVTASMTRRSLWPSSPAV